MSEDALVTREQRGNISVLTMVYRPYNLLGPKLLNAIVEQVEAAQRAGSRAIVIRADCAISPPGQIWISSRTVWRQAAQIRAVKIGD